jgi:hypothetical protein
MFTAKAAKGLTRGKNAGYRRIREKEILKRLWSPGIDSEE